MHAQHAAHGAARHLDKVHDPSIWVPAVHVAALSELKLAIHWHAASGKHASSAPHAAMRPSTYDGTQGAVGTLGPGNTFSKLEGQLLGDGRLVLIADALGGAPPTFNTAGVRGWWTGAGAGLLACWLAVNTTTYSEQLGCSGPWPALR